MKDCDACKLTAPAAGRLKTVGAWAGLIFFCPCHLPLTIAGLVVIISAAGVPIAESWGRPLLYGIFGASFVVFLLIVLRMVSRKRDAELLHEMEHERPTA